jgi:hypothetical protein
MLRIHQAVSSGQFPNASTLAREIEVATKTIHRDIEFMRDRLDFRASIIPLGSTIVINSAALDSLDVKIVHQRVGWEACRFSLKIGVEEPKHAVAEGTVLTSARDRKPTGVGTRVVIGS